MSRYGIVSNEQLKKVTGYDSDSALEKCLRAQKVKILYGKNGAPWTTIDAINTAMGLYPGNDDDPTTFQFKSRS